jgi:hypothetical protein
MQGNGIENGFDVVITIGSLSGNIQTDIDFAVGKTDHKNKLIVKDNENWNHIFPKQFYFVIFVSEENLIYHGTY